MNANGHTSTFTVTNTDFTAVTANTYCHDIVIGESPTVANWPTTDFLIAKPDADATPRRVVIGQLYTFRRAFDRAPFRPGDIVGYVKSVSGTTTFFQDETPL